jgi:hypothetical protein
MYLTTFSLLLMQIASSVFSFSRHTAPCPPVCYGQGITIDTYLCKNGIFAITSTWGLTSMHPRLPVLSVPSLLFMTVYLYVLSVSHLVYIFTDESGNFLKSERVAYLCDLGSGGNIWRGVKTKESFNI